MYRTLTTMILLCGLVASSLVHARSVFDDAVWDLGVGPGGFGYQLYPGSRDTDAFVLPMPYLTFRSPLLEIDRGVKGLLYRSDGIELDISADFALPVDSEDSDARRGMQDLDAVLQLGPSLEFIVDASPQRHIRLELPARMALASDLADTRNLGWLLEPRVSLEHERSGKFGLSYKFTAGVLFASRDYHAYYYDVPTSAVTTQRSAYRSSAGYGGAFVSVRATYKFDDWVLWAFLRSSRLSGAVIDDSPLVETEQYSLIGLGMAWIFASNL